MRRKAKEVEEKPKFDLNSLEEVFAKGFYEGWKACQEYEQETEIGRKVAECRKKFKEFMNE